MTGAIGVISNRQYYDDRKLERYDALDGTARAVKESEADLLNGLVGEVITENHLHRSIDIGTCTGRYLAWAREIGVRDIIGIDHSVDSIDYCRRKCDFPVTLRLGSCADPSTFAAIGDCTLMTMMMGTANHLSQAGMNRFFANASVVSANECVLLFSTWRRSVEALDLYEDEQVAEIDKYASAFEIDNLDIADFYLFDRKQTPWLDIWICKKNIGA